MQRHSVGSLHTLMPVPSTSRSQRSPAERAAALSAVEVDVIGLFVNAVKTLGMPKSVGEIYGLLFISPDPLPLDALVERLNISKGSASQGLKVLRAFGAVKQVYVGGDRRDHYAAETELKKLAAGFIREEIKPRLESGGERLERLKSMTGAESQDDFYKARIAKLAQWHARSQSVMPLLSTMLD
jgi:DNA-binding transcriptional regulator GbsR (MarR family)